MPWRAPRSVRMGGVIPTGIDTYLKEVERRLEGGAGWFWDPSSFFNCIDSWALDGVEELGLIMGNAGKRPGV